MAKITKKHPVRYTVEIEEYRGSGVWVTTGERSGEMVVKIDIDALVERYAARILKSKSLKKKLARGAIVIEATAVSFEGK